MDQFPVEINIDDYWISQIHALWIFSLYLTNPAFYYISAGMMRSFSHGDVSTITPILRRYAYFVQFDRLRKTFYTSMNSKSRNLWTNFLPPAPNMCNKSNQIFYCLIHLITMCDKTWNEITRQNALRKLLHAESVISVNLYYITVSWANL